MKRYLIQLAALSLLALVAGCQKERGGINNPQNGQSTSINISIDGLPIDAATNRAAGDAATTRAVVNDITDITTHGFTIAGYYTAGGVAPDPITDGTFDANIATTGPNVFNYQGESVYSGDAVLVPEYKDGKYEVTLSKWQLRENSYLSYVAWASKVAPGVDAGVVDNPITDATKNGDVGNPFIKVYSGTTTKLYNTDVVAAKSIDNLNNVVRSAVDLDFKHVMTKLKFRVKNDSRAVMTLTGAKILFTNNVMREAKYTFDGTPSRVGTWGSYNLNSAATYPVTLTPTDLAAKGAAVPLEELLIIPQALEAGAISVELTYTIPNGATASTYTRTVPLKARKYEQNTSYTYEIALNETQISINEGRIGAWIDTSNGDLPYVVGARDPNVQLLLDGYDAPYTHTDGNQYWLDRSGWNRHCKIVGGVTYDAAGKFYKFSDSPVNASYLVVPTTFTATTDVTMETVVRSTRPVGEIAYQSLLNFVGSRHVSDRIMFTHFGFNGNTDYAFDAGGSADGNLNRVSGTMPQSVLREFAMYSFTKGPTTQSVRRNLLYLNNKLNTGVHRATNLADVATAQIGYSFKGDIRYFKITTTAKTTINEADFTTLKKRHRFDGADYAPREILADFRMSSTTPDENDPTRVNMVDKINGWIQGSFRYIPESNSMRVLEGGVGWKGNPINKYGSFGNLTIEIRFIDNQRSEPWGFTISSPNWGRGINCKMEFYEEMDDNTGDIQKVKIPFGAYSFIPATYTYVRDQTNRQFRLYQDGVLVITQSVPHFANNFGVSGSTIQGWPGSNSYTPAHQFQSQRIYKTALTAEEVERNAWLDKNQYVK